MACCSSGSSRGVALWALNNRKALMLYGGCGLTVLSTMLFIVGGVPVLTADTTALGALPWAELKIDGKPAYIGVSAISWKRREVEREGVKWSDVSCPIDPSSTATYCQDCKSAATGTLATIILTIITQIPQCLLAWKRTKPETDSIRYKVLGIFTGILGNAFGIAALASFARSCYGQMPPAMDPALGAGFIIFLVGFIVDSIVVLLHFVLPVTRSSKRADATTDTNNNIPISYRDSVVTAGPPDSATL
eukprot:6098215-Pyramimonas_sp.AAC.1